MSLIDVRFLDTLWPFYQGVGAGATSEDVNFPASNLNNPIRAKMWRSSGFFVIGSTNKYIDFKDAAAGGELTATLTEGNYTRAELIIELQSKMAVAGAQIYTVTFGTGTGKWTIASDGAEFQILWNTGTNTANSIGATLGFDTSADETGAVTYTGHKIALHTYEVAWVDLKAGFASTPVDTAALIFDPNRGNRFSEGATVTLVANHSTDWSSPAVSQALTFDEDVGIATHFFSSNQSYRYWGIKIVDPENPDLAVEVHKLLLADASALSQNPDIGFQYEIGDQSKLARNKYGYEYADIYPNQHGFDFNFTVMGYSDVEILAETYERVGNTKPVAIAIDTAGALFDADRFFLYGKLKGSIKPKHKIVDYFDQSLSIVEAF